jgi:hypothetical protein
LDGILTMADTFQTALDRYRDAKEAFRDQRDRMLEDAEFSNPANPQQWDDAARRIRENGPDGARHPGHARGGQREAQPPRDQDLPGSQPARGHP